MPTPLITPERHPYRITGPNTQPSLRMSAQSISQEEISKYWEIFQQQGPVNGLLTGPQMMSVLQNSQLPNPDLEKVWDLADIDGDGRMDFEEFCIAMRLVFDHLKQPSQPFPQQLPQWLVPASKQHLLEAKQALSGQQSNTPPSNSSLIEDEELLLRNDFNWYISPSERREYESIYSINSDSRGRVGFDALGDLYKTLENVPATDISSAWNLVNPKSEDKIDKEQCIVFLHILNQRFKGVRLPRSVPASLRATFGKEMLNYDVSGTQAEVKRPSTSTNSKASLTEGYMSRLGLGGRSQGYTPSGTDFSAAKTDDDWEEARLKRELADLTERLEKIEKGKQAKVSSNTSVIKRELQFLLEYKRKQLESSGSEPQADLSAAREEVMMIAEQLEALKEHYSQRQKQLATLRQELA